MQGGHNNHGDPFTDSINSTFPVTCRCNKSKTFTGIAHQQMTPRITLRFNKSAT